MVRVHASGKVRRMAESRNIFHILFENSKLHFDFYVLLGATNYTDTRPSAFFLERERQQEEGEDIDTVDKRLSAIVQILVGTTIGEQVMSLVKRDEKRLDEHLGRGSLDISQESEYRAQADVSGSDHYVQCRSGLSNIYSSFER